MSENLFVCEREALLRYCNTIENISIEDRIKAESFFEDGNNIEEGILSIEGDKAVISIVGILSKGGPSKLMRFFGIKGTSYYEIIKAIGAVQDNDQAKSILLNIDSPGGYVDGVDEVWEAIKASEKKVIAVNNGLMASGAYWIASAAAEIESVSSTTLTGSIGVLVAQWDYSEALEKMGVKELRIVSRNAPDKAADLTTKEGEKVIQEMIDATERIFIERIAEGRGVTVEKVIADFGQGAVLVAQDPDKGKTDAIKAGMIDRLQNHFDLRGSEGEGRSEGKTAYPIPGAEMETFNRGVGVMETLRELIAANPALGVELEASKTEAFKSGAESVKREAAIVAPFLAADSEYPKAVKALACKVLSGEVSTATFQGAVVAYDALIEEKNNANAIVETEEGGETPPQTPSALSTDGVIRNDADFRQEIEREREGV